MPVGHSFGGVPITGAADLQRRLVYLDARILEDGQHALGGLPPNAAEARTPAAQKVERRGEFADAAGQLLGR